MKTYEQYQDEFFELDKMRQKHQNIADDCLRKMGKCLANQKALEKRDDEK